MEAGEVRKGVDNTTQENGENHDAERSLIKVGNGEVEKGGKEVTVMDDLAQHCEAASTVQIAACSGAKKLKTWKRKGGTTSKGVAAVSNVGGGKRASREVNEMGLEEMELEEMRVFKKKWSGY